MEDSIEAAWALLEKYYSPQGVVSGDTFFPQAEFCPSLRKLLDLLPGESAKIYQSFYPQAQALMRAGSRVETALPPGPFRRVYFVPTRQRVESLGLVAYALLNLEPGGSFYFACANTQGAGGYLSRFKEVCPSLEAESKNKCRYLEIRFEDIERRAPLEAWRREAEVTRVPGTDYWGVPGIFGWNKVDRASELLLETLPALTGVGADLGSGYGFLSGEVLKKNPALSAVHLVEAEVRALECSQKNLAASAGKTYFLWADVASLGSKELSDLDWVVMNPPFHEGIETSPELGHAFIEAASRILKKGGNLYFVANEFLPYEKTLTKHFRSYEKVLQKEGFKVLHAQR